MLSVATSAVIFPIYFLFTEHPALPIAYYGVCLFESKETKLMNRFMISSHSKQLFRLVVLNDDDILPMVDSSEPLFVTPLNTTGGVLGENGSHVDTQSRQRRRESVSQIASANQKRAGKNRSKPQASAAGGRDYGEEEKLLGHKSCVAGRT